MDNLSSNTNNTTIVLLLLGIPHQNRERRATVNTHLNNSQYSFKEQAAGSPLILPPRMLLNSHLTHRKTPRLSNKLRRPWVLLQDHKHL